VTADGLVGKVTLVFSNLSRVTLLTDATTPSRPSDLKQAARTGSCSTAPAGARMLVLGRVSKTQIVDERRLRHHRGTQLGALPDIYPKGNPNRAGHERRPERRDTFQASRSEPFADFTSLDSVGVLVRNGR